MNLDFTVDHHNCDTNVCIFDIWLLHWPSQLRYRNSHLRTLTVGWLCFSDPIFAFATSAFVSRLCKCGQVVRIYDHWLVCWLRNYEAQFAFVISGGFLRFSSFQLFLFAQFNFVWSLLSSWPIVPEIIAMRTINSPIL